MQVVLYLLVTTIVLGLLIVLWRARAYYHRVGDLYQRFEQVEEREPIGGGDMHSTCKERLPALAAILSPGWLLLPLVPFWGLEALESVCYQIKQLPGLLLTDQATEEPKAQDVPLLGGDAILLAEQYDVNSGMAAGVRLEVLQGQRYLISQPGRCVEAGHIPVYAGRPIKREWASIEQEGQRFIIRPIARASIITILKQDGSVHLLQRGEAYTLQANDRVVIGISDYQFVRLPRLALVDDRDGKVVCEDVERAQDWSLALDELDSVRITQGKLFAPNNNWYQSHYPPDNIVGQSRGEFCTKLQPGDRIGPPGNQRWVVRYAVVS